MGTSKQFSEVMICWWDIALFNERLVLENALISRFLTTNKNSFYRFSASRTRAHRLDEKLFPIVFHKNFKFQIFNFQKPLPIRFQLRWWHIIWSKQIRIRKLKRLRESWICWWLLVVSEVLKTNCSLMQNPSPLTLHSEFEYKIFI